MLTSRYAFAGLFLVLHAGSLSAQSAPAEARETLAFSHEAPGAAAPMLLEARLPMLLPVAIQPSGSRTERSLLTNPAAFRDGGRQAMGSRGALIGAAIGGMLGATLSYAACDRGTEACSGVFYVGAAAGALPGAGIGALIGHQFTRGSVAYDQGGRSRKR